MRALYRSIALKPTGWPAPAPIPGAVFGIALFCSLALLAPGTARAQCDLGDTDTGIPCGDITSSGCCDGPYAALYCNGFTLCRDECTFSECGWESLWEVYDCTFFDGGTSDPSGWYPYSCGAIDTGGGGGGGGGIVDTGQPCGAIAWEGCCDGQTLYFCDGNDLYQIDCPQNTTADGQYCGWTGVDGYDCAAAPTEGALPRTCPGACEPDCFGQECGSDGCGGSCGTCAGGTTCNAVGICEGNCEPQCGARICGPDPVCGLSCGSCPQGLVCSTAENACVAACTPNCAGKECGDNGCGGQCGVCAGGSSCQDFRCVSTCVPNCAGKACGSDGCGGTCGTCAAGESCQGGQCVGCVPDCDRRQCGADGCGGVCGTCTPGMICDSQYGICMSDPTCIPQCAGKACGPNGCGGVCGSCGIDFECYEGQCVTCVPQCSGRECGDDGCGGSCGECTGEGSWCRLDGLCTAVVVPADAGPTATPDAAGGETSGPPDPPDDGKPPVDPGTGEDDPCPAGQQRRYGVCVAGDLVTPGGDNPGQTFGEGRMAGGACATSPAGPAAPTAFPWILLLLATALPFLRRRSSGV